MHGEILLCDGGPSSWEAMEGGRNSRTERLLKRQPGLKRSTSIVKEPITCYVVLDFFLNGEGKLGWWKRVMRPVVVEVSLMSPFLQLKGKHGAFHLGVDWRREMKHGQEKDALPARVVLLSRNGKEKRRGSTLNRPD